MADLKEQQDRYFECLEICVEEEQQRSCVEVCVDALTDDIHGPHVFIHNKKNNNH